MMKFIRIGLATIIALLPVLSAAQPVGQLPSGTFWGNATAARAPAAPTTPSAQIDRAISSTQGALLTRNATIWTALVPGTAGLPLLSGGAGANLAYGIPALAAGGTGANLTASNGGLFYSDASKAQILAATATARQMAQSGASSAPAWSTTTWPATTSINTILWSSAANVISALATANSGVLITSSGGVPSISSTLPCTNLPALTGDVTSSAGGCPTVVANITTGATVAGTLLFSNIAAPSTPASGKVIAWTDSTDLRFHEKNSAGTIGTTVVADTGAANNYISAISAAGVITKSRPACATLSDASAFCSGTSAASLTGTLAAGQFPALTGDVTTVAGALASTIAANAVTNAKSAQMAAYTLKGNATGSTANAQDFTVAGLTQKVSPVSGDLIMIQDSVASNATKYATVGSISSAGSVSSIAGNTGAFTLSNGITNSVNDIRLASIANNTVLGNTSGSSAVPTGQNAVAIAGILSTRTRQVFTGSSGTYTTPANVKYIIVRLVGGGGGGAGSGTTAASGTAGGNTTFSTLTGGGGGAGGAANGVAGTGGTASGGDINIIGGLGGATAGANTGQVGQPGGNSCFGGGGGGGFGATGSTGAGQAGATNSGGGGGGGGAGTTGGTGGSGGGGGCVEWLKAAPAATYSYAVGATGGGGGAGTGGSNGGAGGSGNIIVDEFYQ